MNIFPGLSTIRNCIKTGEKKREGLLGIDVLYMSKRGIEANKLEKKNKLSLRIAVSRSIGPKRNCKGDISTL